jgi:hypothetical protein
MLTDRNSKCSHGRPGNVVQHAIADYICSRFLSLHLAHGRMRVLDIYSRRVALAPTDGSKGLRSGLHLFDRPRTGDEDSVKHHDGISTFSIGASIVAEQLDLRKGLFSIFVLL